MIMLNCKQAFSLSCHTLRDHGEHMAASGLRCSQVGPPVVARKTVGRECYESSAIGSRFWCCLIVACHESGVPGDATAAV